MSNEVKTLLLIGKPASGKGTQGELLAETLGWKFVGTGDWLRELAKEDSERGREVAETLARGDFAVSALVDRLLDETLAEMKPNDGIILDGFGRTVAQAKHVHETLKHLGRKYQVIHFKIPDEVSLERMKARSEKDKRSDSDTDENRLHRLEIYYKNTHPVLCFDEFEMRSIVLRTDRNSVEETASVLKRIYAH
jgi:adenylate kinase